MSGGVDSAVAALRLVRAGHDVQGLFMSNWEEDDDAYCTSAQDYQDALAVARELGIPLHKVSFAREYRDRVFAYFIAEYEAGRTPNPDVLCNREIKFGVCLAHARRLGARRFATGHYARLLPGEHGYELHKAVDENKDQTYFLHAVDPALFPSLLFPLGDLAKSEVRDVAREAGLPVFDKPDSTGICFIGERPFADFLSQYVADDPGPIETASGERVGTHRGLSFYTLGQRGGLEIGGKAGHADAAWYVAAKDRQRNVLTVVQSGQHSLLLSSSLRAASMHWLARPRADDIRVGETQLGEFRVGEFQAGGFRAAVKVRHRQPDQVALVTMQGDEADIRFDVPQRAVAPGQFAVLYAGSQCLGGGTIEATQSTICTTERI